MTEEVLWSVLRALEAAGAEVEDRSGLYADAKLLSTPFGYYSINIKRSTWTILGLLLDSMLTMGGASAMLAGLGVTGRLIGKLREGNGELCLYRFLLGRPDPCSTEEIIQEMPTTCSKYDWVCGFRGGKGCVIQRDSLELSLCQLEALGAIGLTPDRKWKVEF